MRAAAILIAALIAPTACKSTKPLASDAPESIRFLAIVEVDESGAVVRAGPLSEWAAGAAIDVVADTNQRVFLVGYDDATLSAANLLDAARADAGRSSLAASVGCQSTLPNATWLAEWAPGGVVRTLESDQTPSLTADWARSTCLPFSPDVSFNILCREDRCEPTVIGQDGCVIRMDLSSCDFGMATVVVDPLGKLCAEFDRVGTCNRTDAYPGESTYACLDPACDLTVHARLDDVVPPMTVEVVPLMDVPLIRPSVIERTRQPFRHNLYEGYVTDLVALDDRVIVTAPSEGYQTSCTNEGPPGRRLLFLDPDTLQVVDSKATEDCITAPIRDPRGDGFLAVYGKSEFVLARFDKDGVRTASASFRLPSIDPAIIEYVIHDMYIDDDGQSVVVAVNAADTESKYAGVRRFDLETLTPIDRFVFPSPPQQAEFAVADGPGSVMLLDPQTRTWLRLDFEDGSLTNLATIPTDNMLRAALFAVHRNGNTPLAAGRGNYAMTGLDVAEQAAWLSTSYEDELHIFRMIDWPADPTLVLAAGGVFSEYSGGAALFDVARRRFVPGMIMFSQSSVTRLVADGRGGVLALLAWKGEIARIRATTTLR